VNRLPFIAVLLALVACSSTPPSERKLPPGTTSTESKPQTPQKVERRPMIIAFGDSLTAGLGVAPGESFPEYLQAKLDEARLEYDVVNEGMSGDTSAAGLQRVDIVAARKPEWVILAFGGNDGLRGLSVGRMKENLAKMIERLQASQIKVLLAGIKLPPNYGRRYTEPFERVFPELAEQYDIPLIPFLLEGVGGHDDLMQDDGAHPTAQGNRQVAENVWGALRPLLEKKH
jgi:acyl-CoA thioesterase-1